MTLTSILLVIVVSFIAGTEGILDEFEFHQPLVSCTLIGLVTGHLQEGIFLGGFLHLIALGWANIGASVAPDVCLASIISSILMVHGLESNLPIAYVIAASIAVSIPLSLIGLSLTKVCRTKAVDLVHLMDETYDVEKYHVMGIVMQGLRVLIPAIILILIPSSWVCGVLEACPEWLLRGLYIGSGVVCVVGFAIVSNVLSSKQTWPFFMIGFGLACFMQVPMLILCLIGAGLVWLVMIQQGTEKVETTSDDPLGDIIDDYE